MLTGDNGILKKATTAKEETTKASAEEKVKIAVYGSYNTEGKIDATELKKNLNNLEGIDKTTTNIKKLPATVICDGYEVTINGTLDGQKLEPGEIVTGKNEKYTKNGTAVIPVGFAIVPELDDVSEGLVISDVANDIENQGNQYDMAGNAWEWTMEAYSTNQRISRGGSYGNDDAGGIVSHRYETTPDYDLGVTTFRVALYL